VTFHFNIVELGRTIMKPAYLFDAYGTILDVHAAVRRYSESIGPDFQAFSDLWRAKQLEYSWVRTLMGTYENFWQLTQDALDYVLKLFGSADPALRTELLDAYLRLEPHDSALMALTNLKAKGARLAFLSNGTSTMLQTATVAAGLDEILEAPFSIDAVGNFKTHPLAYSVYSSRWALDRADIAFVSSNRWDIAGATKAGFYTIWLNRSSMPDEYPDAAPKRVISSLVELLND
jgi:2-haloacid dehalogenase